MAKSKSSARGAGSDAGVLAGMRRVPAPHEFVLDALSSLSPTTRPMFGCLAVYVEDKIVLILRDRDSEPRDNGVWLATTEQHHASLKRQFPSMRSIALFGKAVTHWQVIPMRAHDFEEAALRVCTLIRAGDTRIGKGPRRRGTSRPRRKRSGLVTKRRNKSPS